ncbi:MAG: hypothetical protein JSU77_02320 [Fidelibacterota bacterium]|nr:MAG: hypothetical protein JSU77_02320 [Candidatus Neomarinimicrobiota bacterium]
MKDKLACIIPIFLTMLCISLSCSNNKSTTGPEDSNDIFAIYIVEDTIYGKGEVGLDTLKLSKQPLLSCSDITSYIWSKHQINYSEDVHKQLKGFTDLWRKGFVVIAEGKKIYWGLFQSYLDSYACQNPVIILFPRETDMKHILSSTIYIRRSYFDGEGLEAEPDPRSDARIHNALEKAGVLVP